MSGFGLSLELLEDLWQQGKHPAGDDPLLLAKVVTDDGRDLYLIQMHRDIYRSFGVLVFDPTPDCGLSVWSLTFLDRVAKLCDDFQPQRLSQAFPERPQTDGSP